MHIEDILGGVHNHLAFGEGSIDFLPIFEAIRRINYTGLICVELSRDSHRAADMVQMSKIFLDQIIEKRS